MGEGVAYAPWWMPAMMGADSGTFTTKAELQTAVQAYNTNPDTATATYGLIAGWDVSRITDMSSLFNELKNFNADISSWDTSKVTTMGFMFAGASAFNQPLSFDTSNVTNMGVMFGVRPARALAPNSLESSLPPSMPLAPPPPHALPPPGAHLAPLRMCPSLRLGSTRMPSTSRWASTRPASRPCATCSSCAPRVPLAPEP